MGIYQPGSLAESSRKTTNTNTTDIVSPELLRPTHATVDGHVIELKQSVIALQDIKGFQIDAKSIAIENQQDSSRDAELDINLHFTDHSQVRFARFPVVIKQKNSFSQESFNQAA